MQNVNWVVFPKPHRDLEKCRRWARACGRDGFTETNVNKWTYMCSKHFVGGNGPTKDFPDPIPATFTPVQVNLQLTTLYQRCVHVELYSRVRKINLMTDSDRQ